MWTSTVLERRGETLFKASERHRNPFSHSMVRLFTKEGYTLQCSVQEVDMENNGRVSWSEYVRTYLLNAKGTMSQDFHTPIFSLNYCNLFGSLIDMMKHFRIWLQFCGAIRSENLYVLLHQGFR